MNNRRRGNPAVSVGLVKMAETAETLRKKNICIARVAQIPLYRRQRYELSTRLNKLSHSEFVEEQAKEDGTNFTSSEVTLLNSRGVARGGPGVPVIPPLPLV